MKKFFFLKSKEIAQNAARFIQSLPIDGERPLMVTIQEKTRSLEQSAMLHAIFAELSVKARWCDEKLEPEQWKSLMISAHTIASGEPCRITKGIEGELINLRESTAKMSVKRMASLIQYIHAWCAENNIALSQ